MNHLTVFAEYRAYLFSLACRILGNVIDVEDLLQETFLRWQQTTLAEIRSPKAFLSTVLKHLCLNHLQSAHVRREECVGTSLPESASAKQFEYALGAELTPALLILLERLSPKEQVVFLLRDVFDCDYDEISTMIRKSAVNCRQMLRRARQHITSGHARFVASSEQLEILASQFARTCASGDLRGLVAVLT